MVAPPNVPVPPEHDMDLLPPPPPLRRTNAVNTRPSRHFCQTGSLAPGERYDPDLHNMGTTPRERCGHFYQEYAGGKRRRHKTRKNKKSRKTRRHKKSKKQRIKSRRLH